MVTRLDRLADFLNTDTVPMWLQMAFEQEREEIARAVEAGREYKIHGPAGEVVTITPEHVAA